ncbi:succinate dehydrogenase flavoprotein subunit [Mucor velutinosus]|uniref:Succinate dehydrogenase flavoprotein subunit n=1 Tax=Mucor velutinosus TaxID=708070 RepID=A0AAN7DC31_9FUNG|nr:succinate dehydrogenase flavoprotein subunit [Mucor velutinosus]
MLHGGVSIQFGCMKCLIDTQGGQCFTRTIRNFQYRTLEQLKAPLPVGVKHVFNIKGPSMFTILKSFPANPSFYGLDTLHLLSIGLAKHLYELLSSPFHPSKFDNRYKPSIEELKEAKLDKASAWPYTFDLDPKVLAKIGQYVAQSKKTIPTTFNAPFNDIHYGENLGANTPSLEQKHQDLDHLHQNWGFEGALDFFSIKNYQWYHKKWRYIKCLTI